MAERRKTAAEIRAAESQAWRDLALSLFPKFEQFLESLRPRSSETERLLALLLAELPSIKAAWAPPPQEALPTREYVKDIVEIAVRGGVNLCVGPIKVGTPCP